MECPSCKADTLESGSFCDECGAPLAAGCPSCGTANRPGARFCSKCGCNLLAAPSVAPSPMPTPSAAPRSSPPTSWAERRQLTVMFCDLVGSTALSARLDPEDLRDVIGTYQKCIAEVVGRYAGFVARYMGDGVLVYFGYPQAHEDDAERAVRVGLELITAVSSLKPFTDTTLQCRVGLATGLVIVGELVGTGDAQEHGIIGELQISRRGFKRSPSQMKSCSINARDFGRQPVRVSGSRSGAGEGHCRAGADVASALAECRQEQV